MNSRMNVRRANQHVIFEEILCELRNPTNAQVEVNEVMDYAKSVGGRFIKLRYNGTTASPIKGFQNAVLNLNKGKNGVTLTFVGKTENDGTPCKTARLSFKPDKLGILWAHVPALEYNLKLLAACYANSSAEWVIADKDDEKEISDLADKYAKEFNWSREKAQREAPRPYRTLPSEPKQEPVDEVKPVERPKLKPIKEVKSDNNPTGDVHKG